VGGSYGGFMAAYLATRPGKFAAAVAISPATDWVSQHYTTNIPACDLRFLSGHPLDPGSDYAARNALRSVTAQTAPTLLTAGALDLATPAAQAVMFYRALAAHGVDSDLAIYPEEGHEVYGEAAVVDQHTRIMSWLERYLPETGQVPGG
jgi:dipeptidyl aminopeptidase/acylaminoacyl peptidase